jgi:hypothetical protein
MRYVSGVFFQSSLGYFIHINISIAAPALNNYNAAIICCIWGSLEVGVSVDI